MDHEGDHDDAGRRAYLRMDLGIPARFETLEGRKNVRLVDLSQGGAHVILAEPLDIKQGVLCWLEFEEYGCVPWHKGTEVGIEFEKPLAISVLVETRREAPSVVLEEALSAETAAKDWVAGNFNSGSER